MDIVRIRFVGKSPVTVPLLGRIVDTDDVVELVGVVTADDPGEDHFVAEIGNPREERAWPRTLWINETPAAGAVGGTE